MDPYLKPVSKMTDFSTDNLLPTDGTVLYYGQILDPLQARRYFDELLEKIPWQRDEIVLFGKRIVTARQVAWYGDAGCSYTYSGKTKEASAWTPELLALKAIVARVSTMSFNSCLLNLYRDGGQGMSWHSDDEKELGKNPTIVSLSFGAERKFCFKHKRTQQTISLWLQTGSLLLMTDATQHHWWHSLPKSKQIKEPRINLTFRSIVPKLSTIPAP